MKGDRLEIWKDDVKGIKAMKRQEVDWCAPELLYI